MTQWGALSGLRFGVNFFHLCWSFAQLLNSYCQLLVFLSCSTVWLWTYLNVAKLNQTLIITVGLVLNHSLQAKETTVGVAWQRIGRMQKGNWKEICGKEDTTSANERTKRTEVSGQMVLLLLLLLSFTRHTELVHQTMSMFTISIPIGTSRFLLG